MTRRTMAERKRRASERDARRESLLVLLSRTRRGVPLTPSEAALMFAHVEVELAEADELRRTVAGQQTAIQAAGRRAAAADAVIVEVEKDRDQARAELAELQAAAERATARAGRWEQDSREELTRAKRAEAALARVRDAQTLGDALAAVAEHDGMPAETARVHARIINAAESTEARLAEQARAYEIKLAEERRRGDGWRQHTLTSDARADRYRTAWFAARRDRRADRAAMAAELPLVQAGRLALAAVATLAPQTPEHAAQ
ncbi:hypothetical protein [Streptomyces sp. NPDC048489]|uniref:hypothetical protein n=1 Tax=Streptomyces sp. NPDC048489 TaxID=3154504 RepID=UPI00344572EE